MIKLLKKTAVLPVILMVAITLTFCTGHLWLLEVRLRGAACDGDITRAENLLKRGVNINAADGLGNSALTFVEGCKRHDDPTRVQLVELLIEKGAAVNHRTSDGSTALMYAAGNGDTQAVNALLRNGASVNLADNNGETALMKAAASSCTEDTVKALLDSGADLNARDNKGRNALDSFRASYACTESKVGDVLKMETQKNK